MIKNRKFIVLVNGIKDEFHCPVEELPYYVNMYHNTHIYKILKVDVDISIPKLIMPFESKIVYEIKGNK